MQFIDSYIPAHLEHYPQGRTITQIARDLKYSPGAVRAALQRLETTGDVKRGEQSAARSFYWVAVNV